MSFLARERERAWSSLGDSASDQMEPREHERADMKRHNGASKAKQKKKKKKNLTRLVKLKMDK